jgi:GTP cyclohydrolase I
MTVTGARAAGDPDEWAPALRVVAPGAIDLDAAAHAVADLLVALGQDPTSDELTETPRRVARAFAESLTPEPFNMTTFANDGDYDDTVVVRDIAFHSLCEHHMLPFRGVAHVAYMPGPRVVGLSKLVRLVEHFSCGLQTQERLTAQIADALLTALAPRGVGVLMEATHLCMTSRGVNAAGTTTLTTALRGLLRDDPAMRAEFTSLRRASRGTGS